ncbi:MAG TPA: hypothetical protein VJL81_11125 [Solirubrobacterales bacterium]|nr:hypothetical protein [Solirubrobacterales bacterium]
MVGLLAALVAVGAAAAADPTESTIYGRDGVPAPSLGVHFEKTGFSRVYARADGSLVAQREAGTAPQPEGRVEYFLADGAPDPAAPPTKIGQYDEVLPVAGGKTLIFGGKTVTRLNPDGTPDASFGGTGTVKVPDGAGTVGELGSGKIVAYSLILEGARNPSLYMQVSILNADGSSARSFTITLPSYFIPGPKEIVPLADGGALVVDNSFLLELRADGSANFAFGEGGLLNTSGVAGAHVFADGTIETVGYWYDAAAENESVAVRRYTPTGAPDTSFASEGIRVFQLGEYAVAEVAAWAADGSVYVGGAARPFGRCSVALGTCESTPILAAIDPAGNLEPGFGQGGILKLTGFPGVPGAETHGVAALALRPDGTIVAAGSAPPDSSVAYLAAFTPQGTPVQSFGENGIVSVREPMPAELQFVGFQALPDGKLLAAGSSDVGSADHPVLVRYEADGSLDPSFGAGAGYVSVAQKWPASGFAVDGGEAIVGTYGFPRSSLHMVQIEDGAPVTSFGEGGSVLLPLETQVAQLAFARGGDPVVLAIHRPAGTKEPGEVYRFLADGSRDPAFGHGGKVELRLPRGGEVRAKSVVAAPRGRFLIGGRSGHRFAITRLLPDGRPDPSFGSRGWSVVPVGGPAKYLTLARAGSHIYLAGLVGERNEQDLVLMRFDRDGRLDQSFGRRGRLATSITRTYQPPKIVPTRRGILVVLSGGRTPLITFTRDGGVRRRPVGPRPQIVEDVQATVTDGELILGWNRYSRAIGRQVCYLRKLPLDG